MTGFITRFFDLRKGEAAVLIRTAMVLFGLIAAHTLLETARDALFLGKLSPSKLPLVYVLLAGLSLFVAKGNSRFIQAFGRRNSLILTLQASAFGTVLIYLLPRNATTIFGLYLWSGLLGTVLVVQFWMFAGQLFTVAQSKRLFGPIAAGGVLGAVSGASFAVAALSLLDVTSLMLVASGIFIATGLLLTTLQVDEVSTPAPTRREAQTAASSNSRRYLWRLGALLSLSTAAVLVTDYMFKATAAAMTPPDQLGVFFARYYAVLNAVALTVQLLLASSLVQRTGVIVAATVLPLLLLTGGVGTAALGGPLAAVLLTKGADGALRHSLHRITTELLWLPLPDTVRAKSKALLDTVIIRSIQAAVAAGLFALAAFKLDSPVILGSVVAGFSLLWLLCAMSLRRPYLDLFRRSLARNSEAQALQLDLNAVEVVVESLSSTEPDHVLAAMELLDAGGRSGLIPGLILYHDSDRVLIRALDIISDPGRKDWPPLAERLLTHRVETVRVAALKALAGAGIKSAVEERLLDISPFVRAHAAFWYAQTSPDKDVLQTEGVVRVLSMQSNAATEAQVGLLEAIEAAGDERWSDAIFQLSRSESPKVRAQAVRAMGRVNDPRFIPFLVERLQTHEARHAAREALLGLGEPALDAMEQQLGSTQSSAKLKRQIPRAIAEFGSQRAADILLRYLERESSGAVRYKLLRALDSLVQQHPVRVERDRIEALMLQSLKEHIRMLSLITPLQLSQSEVPPSARNSGKLLLGLLTDKTEQALERAFRLLHVAHPSEDIQSVAAASRSPDRRVRAQAQEFIDALMLGARKPENRQLMKLAIDELSESERLDRAAAYLPDRPLDYREALVAIAHEADEGLARIAAFHACEMGGEFCQKARAVAQKRPFLSQVTELFGKLSADPEAAGAA